MDEPASRSRPLKPHAQIFEQESREAMEELARPARAQLIAGLQAGFGVGFSAVLIAAVLTLAPEGFPELYRRLLIANAYAVGFVLVIMGRADLFTEYTTIALLPVLNGDAGIGALARFWGLVYVANLLGGGLVAVVLVSIGPDLGVFDARVFGEVAGGLTHHPWWVICLSATLAGWIMGLLSWLVVAARESISQILLIWIVGGVIGFAHLHHVITGSVEVFTATVAGEVPVADLLHFLAWTTLGNVIGSVVFAVMINQAAPRE